MGGKNNEIFFYAKIFGVLFIDLYRCFYKKMILLALLYYNVSVA